MRSALPCLVLLMLTLGCESARYTATVGSEFSAGVSNSLNCRIDSDNPDASVVRLESVGEIWMFHGDAHGTATVRCGAFGRYTYRVEVIPPARLTVDCPDSAKIGDPFLCRASAIGANGSEISSSPVIEHWRALGVVEEAPVTGHCEFPPWCGRVGKDSFRAVGTDAGEVLIEAELEGVRGGKSVRIVP